MKHFEIVISYNREGHFDRWISTIDAESFEQAKYIAEGDHDSTGRPERTVEVITEIYDKLTN